MNKNALQGPGPWPDTIPPDGVSLIAGVVIETVHGRASHVEGELDRVEGLEVIGGDGERRLAGVWMAASGKALLDAVLKLIQSNNEDIVGVFPTFIGRDDDDASTRSRVLDVAAEPPGDGSSTG